MTHTNLQVTDWLRVLNWKSRKPKAPLRVFLARFENPRRGTSALIRPEDADRLRLLVNAWLDAKRNWRKLWLPRNDAEHLSRQLQSTRAYFTPDENGRLVTWIDDTSIDPFDVALAFFVRIASDREGWRLCGPCPNPACGKYFCRESRRDKKYCSREKCLRGESTPRMQTTREGVRKAKIELAREGQKEFKRHPRRENWKTWVARYVNGKSATPIDPKSLTRWVNSRFIDDLPLTAGHS
jgi:hypothetical protein